jgi:hypothetical protein
VDLRSNFHHGMEELANALHVIWRPRKSSGARNRPPPQPSHRLTLRGLSCLACSRFLHLDVSGHWLLQPVSSTHLSTTAFRHRQ